MNQRLSSSYLLAAKQQKQPLTWLTASDSSQASIADAAGIDVLLVGDSLGMTHLGFENTTDVTLAMMCHHAAAVVRGRKRAWVVADLPFGSYQSSPEQAFASSVKLLQASRCDAVKLEGGEPMIETIRFLSQRGIAVIAHLGLLPQSIKKMGGYKRQGKTEAARQQLLSEAQQVADAGALAVVLECIPDKLAKQITDSIAIPTVGIGSGKHCDAQVLVMHDLLGLSEHKPNFAPSYMNLRQDMQNAIEQWRNDVQQGTNHAHS